MCFKSVVLFEYVDLQSYIAQPYCPMDGNMV